MAACTSVRDPLRRGKVKTEYGAPNNGHCIMSVCVFVCLLPQMDVSELSIGFYFKLTCLYFMGGAISGKEE